MNCQDARDHLLASERGQLGAELQREVRAHVDRCPACAHEELAERALTAILEQRLPQHTAPLALKRRLAASWPTVTPARPSWWGQWGRSLVPAAAVALVLLAVMPLVYQRGASQRSGRDLIDEAVSDHLRILSSQHPLDIQSGGMHEVKPWFEGRLDFAPEVSFLGDEEFPLQGGAVGYFLDRKAAVFVFHRRLHVISLFVFRAGGLPLPGPEASQAAARGFNVSFWRHGELGYALVSDMNTTELGQLAAKLSGGAPRP